MSRDVVARAEAVVQRWLQERPASARSEVQVIRLPALSTPRFAFFVIAQRGVMHANRQFVVSDGEQVLGRGERTFSEVVHREGLLHDLGALPAALIASLYCRLIGPEPCDAITRPDHSALAHVAPPVRRTFGPPRTLREGQDTVVAFWSVGPKPWDVCIREVRLDATGNLTAKATPVGRKPDQPGV